MKALRLIDFRSFFLDDKVLSDSCQEFFGSQTVQVFHHTIIIDDSQLIGRETNSHEIIIFFVTLMIWILLRLFRSYQCRGSRAVMSVSNI